MWMPQCLWQQAHKCGRLATLMGETAYRKGSRHHGVIQSLNHWLTG